MMMPAAATSLLTIVVALLLLLVDRKECAVVIVTTTATRVLLQLLSMRNWSENDIGRSFVRQCISYTDSISKYSQYVYL